MLKRLLGSQETGNRKRSKTRRPRVEWMEPRTLLTAVSWTGTAGDNNWDTATNWSTDSVPGPGDDVTIALAGANVVHSNNVTDSINSLTSSEPLTISGGTLSIAATSSSSNTLTINGGTLTGAGNLTVGGLVTLTAGTLSGASTLTANGGILFNPASSPAPPFALDARTIVNPVGQTATWTGSNNAISGSDGSVFNNLGTFDAQNNGSYFDTGNGAASSFNDDGTFTQSGSGAGVQFLVPFNVPGGTVNVQDNTFDIERGGTSTGGSFNLTTVLQIGNQPYTFDPTTTITGAGAVNVSGFGNSPQVLPGIYTYMGATNMNGANLQVDGSIADSSENIVNGTLSGTGTVGPVSGEVGLISPGDSPNTGILNVQGDVDIDDDWEFAVILNGQNAGTGYSQLNANGSVTLGGADLNASLGAGFTPTPGEQFTIVQSDAPVVGTFGGLPEGASLTIGNTRFTISYVGGGGDDVVLTQATAAAPTVTGLMPTSGPDTGGTPVTITGTGFTGAIVVDFGITEATNLVVVNDTTITVVSPPGSAVVDVTVTTPGGTSATSPADQFTYTAAAAPTVTGISPSTGPSIGGTLVTITGTGFTGATNVEFGTTAATNVVVESDTAITADSPAGTGIASVTVTTPGGTSAATPADQFTYVVTPPPTVVSLLRFGFHAQPTSLVLTFSSPLDATRAEDVHNFKIVTLGGKGKNGNLVGHVTRVSAAVYDSSTLTVTLFTAQRLDIHNLYQLTVNGMTPSGLTGATGVPLAGQGDMSGTNYVKVFSGKLLAGPAPSTANAARRPKAATGRVIKGPSAAALDQLLASGNWTARPNSARIHGGHHHRRG